MECDTEHDAEQDDIELIEEDETPVPRMREWFRPSLRSGARHDDWQRPTCYHAHGWCENDIPITAGIAWVQIPISDADDLKDTFQALAQTWRRETEHQSSINRIVSHRNYQDIIRLAFRFGSERVIALVLRELKKRPNYWFMALETLTGESFHQADGDFNREVRAWLKWGQSHGYL